MRGIGSPASTAPDWGALWAQHVYETLADHRVVQYDWREGNFLGVTDLGGYSVDGVAARLLRLDDAQSPYEWGQETVAARGRHNAIWYRETPHRAGPWSPWRSLGASLPDRPCWRSATATR
jgi:hypothetical protein